MKRFLFVPILLVLLISGLAYADNLPWAEVENVFDRKGTRQGDMLKLTFPRTDLNVTVDQVQVAPGIGLTPWLVFKPMGQMTMLMGDLVLLEEEIQPVVNTLVSQGLEITALHNHIVNAKPGVMFMHVAGHGDAVAIAKAVKLVLEQTNTPLQLQETSSQEQSIIDWASVEAILGVPGTVSGDVAKFAVSRAETITEHGVEVPVFMGSATVINFQAVGDNQAVTTGDFVLLADEVNPVIRALTRNGIKTTALHNHMLHESPRLFFLHFWGHDTLEALAKGLKQALDETNSRF
jgi:hypothetical protein